MGPLGQRLSCLEDTLRSKECCSLGIDTSSTFKSTSIEFEFGVPFDETTGDGTEVRTTATLSGNSLIKDQRAVKSSGVSRIETRNFKNSGQIMELVHTIPGKANIRSVRVYKKLY